MHDSKSLPEKLKSQLSITLTKFLLFNVLALIQLFFVTTQAKAQTADLSLGITPPLLQITMKPGKTAVYAFMIENDGTKDLQITPELKELRPDSETGAPVVVLNSAPLPYATLQNLDKKFGQAFTLQANSKDQLVVRFSPPENEPEGDNYYTLLLQAKAADSDTSTQNQAQNSAAVGSNILISVSQSGEDKGILSIKSAHFPKFIDSLSPFLFELLVKNSGSTLTQIQGDVQIVSSLTGEVVKVFPLLPENVLSGHVRQAHGVERDPEDSKGKIGAPMLFKPFALFGKYTVQVKVHGNTQEPITQIYSFWAIPFSGIAVITSLFLAAFCSYLIKKKRLDETIN